MIVLDGPMQWSEIPDIVKSIKPTLAERIAKWGTNLIYKAKSGENILSPFFGEKKVDRGEMVVYLKKSSLFCVA